MLSRTATCLLAHRDWHVSAMAAEVRVLAPNAAKESVTRGYLRLRKKPSGHKIVTLVRELEAITKGIERRGWLDVVCQWQRQNMRRQSRTRKRSPANTHDFAALRLRAFAVPAAAKVDVSTSDALKAALLSARTIVVS